MLEKNKRTIILIQGFGWTGSGVLVDFLLDNESIKLVSNTEVAFLKVLINLIDKTKKRKKIDIVRGTDEILFTGEIPSCYTGYVKSLTIKRFNLFFSLATVNKLDYKDYTLNILKNLNEISNRPLLEKINNVKINQIMSDYWIYLNSIFQEESKILMYDNLLYTQRLEVLEGLSYSKISDVLLYIVDRDPRDQYFELYNMFKLKYIMQSNKILHVISKARFFRKMADNLFFQFCSALAFIYIYHKPKRLGFYRGEKILKNKSNSIHIRKVRFEDFVFNYNSIRDIIQSDVDSIVKRRIGGSSWNHGVNFNPQKSQQNVGVYKRGKKRKIYNFILDQVSKYDKFL